MASLSLPTGLITACELRDLAKAVRYDPVAAASVVQQGFLAKLAALLDTGAAPALSSNTKMWVLRLLWCLSKHVQAPYMPAAQPEILVLVLAALREGACGEHAYACLDAVRACVSTESGNTEFIIAGGVAVLGSVLARTACPPMVTFRALNCMVTLQRWPHNEPLVLARLRTVYAAMAAHKDSVEVQCKGLQLLSAVAADSAKGLVANRLAADAVAAARVAMDTHLDSPAVQQYGCQVLGSLPGLLHVSVAVKLVIRAMSLESSSCITAGDGCTALYSIMKNAPAQRSLMQLLCIKFIRGVRVLHPTCSGVKSMGTRILAYLGDIPADMVSDSGPDDSDSNPDSDSTWESDAGRGDAVRKPYKRLCVQ